MKKFLLNLMKSQEKTKRDINNRLVIDTLYNFIIDTDNMILNQYENYTSITAPIYRINSQNNNTNTFENIVIIENFDDNSKQAFLITYNPSSDYIQSVTTNSLPAYKGEIAIQNLDYNSVDISSRVTCITYTQAICRNNGCAAGPGCFDNRDGGEHIIYETSIVCFSVNDVPVFVDMNESGTGGGESSTIYGSNSGTNNLNNTIITEPVVPENRTEQKLLQNFTTLEQSNWWLFVASDETKDDIINYLNQNTINNVFDTEALYFTNQFSQNAAVSGLNLDFEKSVNSPANIDFTSIDTTTTEGKQFSWIYDKLMENNTFKEMFYETFQIDEPRINVKFEIVDSGIPADKNAKCVIQGSNGNWYNTIKIKKSIFGAHSNLSIAKTILHECIHAYLNIKKIDQNLGTTIAALNGLDLGQLLGTFSTGFGGVPVSTGTVTQHDFMFNYMIPVFTDVLLSLKDKLISPFHISQAENQDPWVLSNNEVYPFNWTDLFYYLSLNGLHESTPFLSQFPAGSINYEKYDFVQQFGVDGLTKSKF